VANQLVRDGFVEGIRGKGGGPRLRAPADINIGAVVRRMERGMELVECFGSSSNCLLTPNCRLKGGLAEALEAFLMVLDHVSLADLLGVPQKQLLHFVRQVSPAPDKALAVSFTLS
jgi:Rrf2 family transcriptional regulator, nitric oxide-sensitive transcriptional repressor